MSNVFEEVRNGVTIAQAIQYLGLKPTETKGDQMRFGCPNCGGSDKRTLSVNLTKGFQCFSGSKRGDDATSLVAHVKNIRQRDAAEELAGHFLRNATEARAKAPAKGRGDTGGNVDVSPLELLGISDNRVFRLGIMEEDGRVLFPMRDDKGVKLGTLMIATRADLPLVAWSTEDAEEIVKADVATDLKSLWRVVKGGA